MSRYLLILPLLFVLSCKEDTPTSDDLLSQMNGIYDEIEELIITSCESSDACIASPIGVKPCGGPTKFIVHSSATDQQKLDDLIEEYNELNSQYNEQTGIGSDCALETPPSMDCISGECAVITD
ncbi:MAG: hypothetical protein RLN88_01740 [Ekhidna sp.]|uniref:hypothetical protein n=1 Tax=Ekhidna sp. TaxID=2608089 RepID=UPI0032EB6B03